MPDTPAPAVTPAQLSNIADAIAKNSVYLNDLLAASHKAAAAGELNKMQQLTGPFQDASALQQQLVALRSIPLLNDLNTAIAAVKQATATLNSQKTQIDGWVKAVDTAATVINVIASIVASVTRL